MITIYDAVNSLRPKTEWVMHDNNVEEITWITQNVDPLKSAEVQAEIKRLEAASKIKEAEDKQTRLDAIEHAKSLGFTDAMIAVMYPNLGAQND